MPNYSKIEGATLSDDELLLSEKTRQPVVSSLETKQLLALIKTLEETAASAGEPSIEGPNNRRAFLDAALRRAKAERRHRGLNSKGKPSKAALAKKASEGTDSIKAAAPAPIRATVAKKRSDKPRSAPSKRDLRTSPRLAPHHRSDQANPAPAEQQSPPVVAEYAPQPDPMAAPPALTQKEAEKAARKEARKAERMVAKEAEKAARKAQRAALKQAEKDLEKAERKAARKAQKAAEAQGAADDLPPKPSGKKSSERKV